MSIYSDFAYCYDLFMDDIPYDNWTKYIVKLLNEREILDGLVCELGCGTGEVTMRLADAGYDMIGIDFSEDMLMVARDKLEDISDVLYLHQDMRDFELYGTVKAFVSVCDSMNYILTKEDLVKVFKNVNNYLERNGVFIFDLKTEHFFKNSYGRNTFTEEREEGMLVWENNYDEERKLNSYLVTVDLFDDEEDAYDEVKEEHVQRAYTLDEIKEALAEAGLVFETAFEAFTDKPPTDGSDRIYVIAREGFQQGKKY